MHEEAESSEQTHKRRHPHKHRWFSALVLQDENSWATDGRTNAKANQCIAILCRVSHVSTQSLDSQ